MSQNRHPIECNPVAVLCPRCHPHQYQTQAIQRQLMRAVVDPNQNLQQAPHLILLPQVRRHPHVSTVRTAFTHYSVEAVTVIHHLRRRRPKRLEENRLL